jgi:imidazolonepropionase-like amidohydrolase
MTGDGEPLSQNLDDYDGRWVAVRDGAIVAAGHDEESVRADTAVRDGDLVYPIGDPPSGFYLINV